MIFYIFDFEIKKMLEPSGSRESPIPSLEAQKLKNTKSTLDKIIEEQQVDQNFARIQAENTNARIQAEDLNSKDLKKERRKSLKGSKKKSHNAQLEQKKKNKKNKIWRKKIDFQILKSILKPDFKI